MEKQKRYFITAINTGSGKTVASAIIAEALKADYWKPVQAGSEEIDKHQVQKLISNEKSKIHPERYFLQKPASPHNAAKEEGFYISVEDFQIPETENDLIIEGAGGILVPLNDQPEFIIDLAQKFNCEIILVSDFYLGSINHTLLSIHELWKRNLSFKGIIFCGTRNIETEDIILEYSGVKKILNIEFEEIIDHNKVFSYSKQLAGIL